MPTARRALTGLALAGAAVAVVTLLPTQLGGSTSVVKAAGRSMEPAIHAGDLAILRRQPEYRVGDVIAYSSQTLHEMVLHRVVQNSDGRYQTRGDNNSWLDPDRPTASEISGRQWLLLPHGGVILTWLSLPIMIMVGAVARILSSAGHRTAGTTRQPAGRPAPVPRHATRSRFRVPIVSLDSLPSPTTPGFTVACILLAFGAMWLGSAAFGRPTHVVGSRPVSYQQEITLDYRGRSMTGIAYPKGVLGWGDPVYTRLVDSIVVTASHHVDGPQLGPVSGRLTLTASSLTTRSSGAQSSLRLANPVTAFLSMVRSRGRRSSVSPVPFAASPLRSKQLIQRYSSHGRLTLRRIWASLSAFRPSERSCGASNTSRREASSKPKSAMVRASGRLTFTRYWLRRRASCSTVVTLGRCSSLNRDQGPWPKPMTPAERADRKLTETNEVLLKAPSGISCGSSRTRCCTQEPHQPLNHEYGCSPPKDRSPAQARPESGARSTGQAPALRRGRRWSGHGSPAGTGRSPYPATAPIGRRAVSPGGSPR